ncbi:LOW QUALITY PROTEIN: putative membrane protein, partial [Streptomyces himastatinicus ATCC 53653]
MSPAICGTICAGSSRRPASRSSASRPTPTHRPPRTSRPRSRSSSGADGAAEESASVPHPRRTAQLMAYPTPQEGPDRPGDRAVGPAAPSRRSPPGVEHLREEAVYGTGPQTDRLRYLDTATRQIARGMDLDETLHELCRAAVPAFADAAVVHLRDPLPAGDEEPPGPLVLCPHAAGPEAAPDAGPGAVPEAGPGVPPGFARLTVTGRLAELLSAGRPAFGDVPGIAAAVAELLSPAVGGPGPVPPGRRLIIAPLRGREHTVMGAAVLVRHPDRPPFTGDDLLVASQLATHTALGMNKAVLYGREVSVADALQRTMLPASLPEPIGVRLATRYLPSSKTARIGGDWYDAIPLPGNRVALVIGDVMGHSMTSAAIMGQLRTTVQTLAGLDLSPDEVLHHLDEQAQRLGSQHMATCLYGIYDPIAHRLLMANAGHPPPVLLQPGGRGQVLRIPPGPPVGVGGVSFETVEMFAPTGATLLLYTDGLVESRDTDVATGVERLRDRLHTTAQVLDPPAAGAAVRRGGGRRRAQGPGRRHRAARRPLRRNPVVQRRLLVPGPEAADRGPGPPPHPPHPAPLASGLAAGADRTDGQRGGHQRRPLCLPAGDVAAAAHRCAALRGGRRLAVRAQDAARPPGRRGRPRPVPGQPALPALGRDPVEHRQAGVVRTAAAPGPPDGDPGGL